MAGIVFVNTEPGDYILSATKEGVVFESVKLKCRPEDPLPIWSQSPIL